MQLPVVLVYGSLNSVARLGRGGQRELAGATALRHDEVVAVLTLPALRGLLLPTKLHPPHLRANRIVRARLLAQLDAAQTKLTLLVAPAGCGKTTLLSQWAQRRAEPVAWLALSPEDNALPTFVSYLITAIGNVDRDLIEVAVQHCAVDDRADSETMFAAVLSELATYAVPWALVLDDYHVIANPAIDHVVRQLIEHTPDECRVVIASRTEPALPFARLRVRDELTLLNADDLRVTTTELSELFDIHGIAVPATEQLTLNELTNGWFAALHLAAIASSEHSLGQVIKSLAAFDGDLDLLGDYLLQEVLDQQPPELRVFLLQTAILERFTVAACHAVTHLQRAGQLLEQVQRRSLFLVPLDRNGEWYHYHHLFRDFLRRRLALEAEPSTIAALHAAASEWFEQQGLLGEAIAHAIHGEDWARAATLISSLATTMLERQGDLLAWLHSFPTAVLYADPNLSSLTAFALARDGRGAESAPLLAAAEQQWRAAGQPNGLALVGIVRGTLARFREDGAGLVANAVEAIAQATGEEALDANGRLAALTPRQMYLEDTWLGHGAELLSYFLLAAGLRLLGRVTEAAALYRQIEDVFVASGVALTATDYAPEAADNRLAQGQLTRVEALCRAYLQQGETALASERMHAMALLGDVLREWNRLAEAEELLREGLALAARFETPIFLPALYSTLARTLWSRSDADGARAALEAGVEAAVAVQNLRRLHEVEALRVRITLAGGDLAPARRWVAERGLGMAGASDRASLSELLVYARLLMAEDETAEAVALLTRLAADAARDGRQHDLLQVDVLRCMAHVDLFELDQAIAVLQPALELAEPEGYMRVFLDEGASMSRLLRVAQRRGVQVHYIQRLLAAAGEEPGDVVRITHRELVEPITARELEVLRLIGVGLTNRELSDELVISVATVKRHVSNLYGKLGVSSRSEAVHKARKLGLLSGEPAVSPLSSGEAPQLTSVRTSPP